jgi:hypothetical protein
MKTYIALIVMLIPVSLCAQITVTAESLPDIGDELEFTIFSNFEDTLEYRKSGADVEWNFDSFNPVTGQVESYLDIAGTALGDTFPEANMIVDIGLFQAAAERTDSTIAVVGIEVDMFGGIDVDTDINLEEPFRLRYTPFEFNDTIEDEFQIRSSLSAEVLPFLDSLDIGLPGAMIDSIRITLDITKREEAIGWGTVTIAGQEKEVLQILENNTTETVIEVGVTLFGAFVWLDVSDILGDMAGAFLDNQDTKTYKFMTADDKRPVIEFDETEAVDTAGVATLVVNGRTSAEFLTNINENIINDSVILSPNPADQYIDISNIDLQEITDIQIYNINGHRVMSQTKISNTGRMNIEHLSTGTYVILLQTERGSITEKFVIK